MKTKNIILTLVLVAMAWLAQAQGGNEFTIPLSDPAKRGKLKAHLNYGSITVKGTARKDVLVKYSTAKGEDDDDNDDDHGKDKHKQKSKVNVNVNNGDEDKSVSKEGLKRISGSGVSDATQRNCSSGCYFRIRMLQSRCQRFDGFGVASDSDGIDCPYQQFTFE